MCIVKILFWWIISSFGAVLCLSIDVTYFTLLHQKKKKLKRISRMRYWWRQHFAYQFRKYVACWYKEQRDGFDVHAVAAFLFISPTHTAQHIKEIPSRSLSVVITNPATIFFFFLFRHPANRRKLTQILHFTLVGSQARRWKSHYFSHI